MQHHITQGRGLDYFSPSPHKDNNMLNKNSSEQTYSHFTSKLSELRKKGIEHGSFQAFVKRQSLLFPNWRAITMTLIESPHEQLMVTIRKRNESKIEEVINVTYSKMSKRFANVDHHHCFGLILPSSKKYLFAGRNEGETIDLYNKITNLRKDIKIKYNLQSGGRGSKEYREIAEERDNDLQFQRCDSDKEEEKFFSTNANTTPKKQSEINYPYQKRMERQHQEELIRDSFYTAQQEEQQQHQQRSQRPLEQQSLHLQQPISEQQVTCLQSDEGFKLLHNFNEGRFLTKGQEMIKANLLISSHLSPQALLETFFHFQLWNQRIKQYTILNRIDKGIYLAKLELHRKNMFSLPRYCYLMVNTWKVKADNVVIFRSLEQSHFQKQRGYNYFNMSIWVRVKEAKEDNQQLMNICARFSCQQDFEAGLLMLEEIKTYQVFLRTSGPMLHQTLEWSSHQIQQ